MLVSMNEVLKDACKNGYAIGAFNAYNLEALQAIIEAAEETGKGVIINYAEVHAPLIPLEEIAPIMVMYANKASVPVCLNLDHGTTVESCMTAMRLGFTSVMIDASALSYEDNVKNTALVCRLAHSIGVSVEAELGHIITSDIGMDGVEAEDRDKLDPDSIYTDPDVAKDFVEKTGVDALAIAFGTAHGIYTVKPKLDLDRITRIREKIDIPFVMHGGSGLSKEEFQTAIRNGIRKINYYTYMALVGGKAVKEAMDNVQSGESVFFHDIPKIAREAMKKDVINAIRIFSLEA
ncbi:ketose-bisphosphate aldolase [Oribacterium sp. C9]|uniref:class II fructose-bisphosphate aldolase n=1 Tax=Oribacterium sp. C9 TaxID=1943579 RepID=UPI00098EE8BE|nr:class II fructose-bisphosphate aldolase [Oribacterium sp. C9]OON85973.1 ketose-bisphosphate aldolase [Oribacterium sp. C9]